MAGVQIFPLEVAEPTKPIREFVVSETDATAHLLRYTVFDPLTENLYYPSAEHDRFKFWMNDRIRRHRTLAHLPFT